MYSMSLVRPLRSMKAIALPCCFFCRFIKTFWVAESVNVRVIVVRRVTAQRVHHVAALKKQIISHKFSPPCTLFRQTIAKAREPHGHSLFLLCCGDLLSGLIRNHRIRTRALLLRRAPGSH